MLTEITGPYPIDDWEHASIKGEFSIDKILRVNFYKKYRSSIRHVHGED